VSARTRVYLVVAFAALAAVALAVGGGLALQRADDDAGEPPVLELSVLAGGGVDARALRAAERAYEQGDQAGARKRFEAVLGRSPDSIEAAVGAAVAAWPDGTVERLKVLAAEHPASALVRLHLGLALFARGERDEAVAQWREAKARDPDTPSAVRAEDLLHPEMAPGRPYFYPSSTLGREFRGLSVSDQLDLLETHAQAGGVDDLLLYGFALQRVGRPLSAQAAFEDAVRREPESVEAQAALAVSRFDKDVPAQAFSRLGPLARDHPRSPVVRFHLGLLLLWIREVEEAREQLRLAVESDEGGFYGLQARDLLSRLKEVRT
jgi:tetratricopeptide (TPR) repeat protein